MKTRSLRVLIADDCKDAANSLGVLVNIWQYQTRVAYDGAAALELAADFQPDVVLLDVAMPALSGFEVALQLRRRLLSQNALLVAITGYADEAHRLLWEKAFDHFLIKPAEPALIEELLRREQRRLENLEAACLATPRQVGIPLVNENWRDHCRSAH